MQFPLTLTMLMFTYEPPHLTADKEWQTILQISEGQQSRRQQLVNYKSKLSTKAPSPVFSQYNQLPESWGSNKIDLYFLYLIDWCLELHEL